MMIFPAQSRTETKAAALLFSIVLLMASVSVLNFSSQNLFNSIVNTAGIILVWGFNFYFFGWERMRFAAITLMRGTSEKIEDSGKESLRLFLTGYLLETGLEASSSWAAIALTDSSNTGAPCLKIQLKPDVTSQSALLLKDEENFTAMWLLTKDGDPYRLLWMKNLTFEIDLGKMTAHEKIEAMHAHRAACKDLQEIIRKQASAAR